MTVFELYTKLTERVPTSLSMGWDGDGFEICPDKDAEVKRVLISLDVTNDVIDRAVEGGFDVIVAHHPMLFNGLKEISVLSADGSRAVKLIKNNISVMTFHTRLDSVDGGVNDVLAALLGLSNIATVEFNGNQVVRVGELEEEMDASEFAAMVKERLSCPAVSLAKASGRVKRVALIGGSGGSEMGAANFTGADTFITGELKHHEMLSARDIGVNLIVAGHFYTEHPVCDRLSKMIGEILPEAECEVYFSDRVEVL